MRDFFAFIIGAAVGFIAACAFFSAAIGGLI